MIGVIVTGEPPHWSLTDHERLETPLHEGADHPLTRETLPPLLGDGFQHVLDLRVELLLRAIDPLGFGHNDSIGELWGTSPDVLHVEPLPLVAAD